MKYLKMKLIAGVISLRQKWNFLSGDKYHGNAKPKLVSNRKYLHMRIFHKNKVSGSKDQNKNDFHFFLPTMETNMNKKIFCNTLLNSVKTLKS